MKVLKFDNFLNEAYIRKGKIEQVKKDLKLTFPEFEFSIIKPNYSSIIVYILSGPIQLTDDLYGYEEVNHYNLKNQYRNNPEVLGFLEKVYDIVNKGNYSKYYKKLDYLDIGFYINICIGQYDKPYVVKNKVLI